MKLMELQKPRKPTKEEREAQKNAEIDAAYALIKQIHKTNSKEELEKLKQTINQFNHHKAAYKALSNAVHQKERMM